MGLYAAIYWEVSVCGRQVRAVRWWGVKVEARARATRGRHVRASTLKRRDDEVSQYSCSLTPYSMFSSSVLL